MVFDTMVPMRALEPSTQRRDKSNLVKPKSKLPARKKREENVSEGGKLTAAMTIPAYQKFMRPVLEALRDGKPQALTAMRQDLVRTFKLTEEQCAARFETGSHRNIYQSRVGYAVKYLFEARTVRRSGRGVYQITARGLTMLHHSPSEITTSDLGHYPEFDEWLRRSAKKDR